MEARPRDPDDEISDVSWAFGDGESDTGTVTSHAWDAADDYEVTVNAVLNGTDPVGTATEIHILPRAPEPPVADFTFTPTTAETNQPVMFTDRSDPVPTSWEWTFDGATGSGT